MTWHDITWHDTTRHNTTRHDTTRRDMTWHDTIYMHVYIFVFHIIHLTLKRYRMLAVTLTEVKTIFILHNIMHVWWLKCDRKIRESLGVAFIRPDQLDECTKDQLGKAMLFTIFTLQLLYFENIVFQMATILSRGTWVKCASHFMQASVCSGMLQMVRMPAVSWHWCVSWSLSGECMSTIGK